MTKSINFNPLPGDRLIIKIICILLLAFAGCGTTDPTVAPTSMESTPQIGLYRTFERSLTNSKRYSNKFTDVELQVSYRAPSGKTIDFFGFFDGDGNGGGNKKSGKVWKIRFMPDELGTWNYTWSWSDGTAGGEGSFITVAEGAGKGILRPYKDNPRWFAYNGTDPVYLKSYYETGHGTIAQPFDWIKTNIYQPLIANGYNHLQVNWLLPLCCDHQWYHDGPDKSIDNIRLYDSGKASSTMRLNVWQMMEEHVQWLNDNNVGLHMFLGFDGGRNDGPDWKALSKSEKNFYVMYVVARLAPYANIAGWNYVSEVNGDDPAGELELAQLLQIYDIFDHLRTYHDAAPGEHEYNNPVYNFAAIENHGFSDKDEWGKAWTHHEASLAGYVPGKPVYMSEGNALWRRYWHKEINENYGYVDQDDLRQSAWACVTAGASFNWCGHAGDTSLVAFGAEGLPFYGAENPFLKSEKAISILTRVLNKEVVFYSMKPMDSLLSEHDPKAVWCLSQPGEQYLVYACNGESFALDVAENENGIYENNIWINAETGVLQKADAVGAGISSNFFPPDTSTDWILILRSYGSPLKAADHWWHGGVSDDVNDPANWTDHNASTDPTTPCGKPRDIVRIGGSWDSEDINENGILDPGEDLNGNGIIDDPDPNSGLGKGGYYGPDGGIDVPVDPVLRDTYVSRTYSPEGGWWFVLNAPNILTLEDGAFLIMSAENCNLRNGGRLEVQGRSDKDGPSLVVARRFRIGENGSKPEAAHETSQLRINGTGWVQMDPALKGSGAAFLIGTPDEPGTMPRGEIIIEDNGRLELLPGDDPENPPYLDFGNTDPTVNQIIIRDNGELWLPGDPNTIGRVGADNVVTSLQALIDMDLITSSTGITVSGSNPTIVKAAD